MILILSIYLFIKASSAASSTSTLTSQTVDKSVELSSKPELNNVDKNLEKPLKVDAKSEEVVAVKKASTENVVVKRNDVTQTSETKIESVNLNNNVIIDVEKPLTTVVKKTTQASVTSSDSNVIPPVDSRETVSPSPSHDDFVEGKNKCPSVINCLYFNFLNAEVLFS